MVGKINIHSAKADEKWPALSLCNKSIKKQQQQQRSGGFSAHWLILYKPYTNQAKCKFFHDNSYFDSWFEIH